MHHFIFVLVIVALLVYVFMSWGSIEHFFASHLTSHTLNTANTFQPADDTSSSVGGVVHSIRSKF
jgi:hypothetical protein